MAAEPVSNYEDVFEEGDIPKEAQTVHRIRANSTIMQLNKILGECQSTAHARGGERRGARGRGWRESDDNSPLHSLSPPLSPSTRFRTPSRYSEVKDRRG